MNEQLNRQCVLKLLEMFYAGDIEGVLAQCSDDIDHFVSAPIDILPHLGPRRGKADVRQMWRPRGHAAASRLIPACGDPAGPGSNSPS